MENVADFTPPAIGYDGKRRIFHALDHLKIIKDDKTAQQHRRACRCPRAGSVFSARKQVYFTPPAIDYMEHVTYFTPKAIGYDGTCSGIHITSDRLLWKTSHISHLGPLKHYKRQ